MRDGFVDGPRRAVHVFEGVAVGEGAHRRARRVARKIAEGIEGRLFESAAALLRHDGRDDVDELRKAADLHNVAVVEQRIHEACKDERVAEGIDVFEKMRRLLPKRLGAGRVHRPDVPLVEADLQMPLGTHFGAHIFDGRLQRADILVHVVGGTQEVLQRALPRLVVLIIAVHGEIIDRLIGVFEDNAIPFGEGLHLVVRGARDDELQVVRRVLFIFAVRPAHDFGGFERLFAVLVGA